MRRHCRDRATASAKVVGQALFEVCHAVEIDRLVTDRAPGQPLLEVLREAGVEVALPG